MTAAALADVQQRLDRSAGREKNDGRANETKSAAQNVPAIGSYAFDAPEPDQGREDVDASIGGVGPTSGVAFHEREQPGKGGQRQHGKR